MKPEAILDKVIEGAILLNVEVGKNLTAEIRAIRRRASIPWIEPSAVRPTGRTWNPSGIPTFAEETDRIDAIVAQFGEQEVTALRALPDGLEITTRAVP